jgi:type II secretory pathway pseudopilin PulG
LTLVETLIVLAILSLLVQLMLPAIQASREAARRTQCLQNLRQLSIACALHEGAHRHLPSGGWGWKWVGDPDRGTGPDQPGGWHYQILPYTEQRALYELGRGQTEQEKRQAAAALSTTLRSGVNCPSQRVAQLFPIGVDHGTFNAINSADTPAGQLRSDYAMNGGDLKEPAFFYDSSRSEYASTPDSLAEGDSPDFLWAEQKYNTGVCFVRTPVRLAQITDGLSQTYLIGEKALSRSAAETGTSPGDNLSLYQGYDFDVVRWAEAANPETRPELDQDQFRAFGSVHPSGFHMALCDGSVRLVDFAIDPTVHEQSATRAGSEPAAQTGAD